MFSDRALRRPGRSPCAGARPVAALFRGAGPRFYPDDPITADNDTAFDASGARPRDLSEAFDFLTNQFGDAGDRSRSAPSTSTRSTRCPTRAGSPTASATGRCPSTRSHAGRTSSIVSTSRSGSSRPARAPPDSSLASGPSTRGTRGRSSSGPLYQLELDLEDFPDLATSAEVIGTAIYHAIGYNVVDTYIVNVDPKKVHVAPNATVRDPSGRRPLTQRDIDEIFKLGARNPDGTYRMSAGRFVEGRPMGNFTHFGTRPDDPNDIYPHEHRREIRANRVFAAWIQPRRLARAEHARHARGPPREDVPEALHVRLRLDPRELAGPPCVGAPIHVSRESRRSRAWRRWACGCRPGARPYPKTSTRGSD